ncbi:hypothetical protein ACFLV6_01315 [Chloroflexota bacterium]
MNIDEAQHLLETIDIGKVSADRDTNLNEWFVNTPAFGRVISDDISLVLGDKGTGKTAIYRYLVENQGFIEGIEEYIIVPTSDIQGIADFHQLLNIAQGSSDNFRQVWRLYFAILLGKSLISASHILDINVDNTNYNVA